MNLVLFLIFIIIIFLIPAISRPTDCFQWINNNLLNKRRAKLMNCPLMFKHFHTFLTFTMVDYLYSQRCFKKYFCFYWMQCYLEDERKVESVTVSVQLFKSDFLFDLRIHEWIYQKNMWKYDEIQIFKTQLLMLLSCK